MIVLNSRTILESCNITQNVHMATHLHGYILDLVLTPADTSGISNVQVAEFISDHALVRAQLDLVIPPSQRLMLSLLRGITKLTWTVCVRIWVIVHLLDVLAIQSMFCVNNT